MTRKRTEQAASTDETTTAEAVTVATAERPSQQGGEKAEREWPIVPPPGTSYNHKPKDEGEGQGYPPEPNPRSWAHNNQAGIQLLTSRDPYEAALAFREKPSQAVIDHLKANGFRWNGREKVWTRPVKLDTQAQDRLTASRTYREAVDMTLAEKGIVSQEEMAPQF